MQDKKTFKKLAYSYAAYSGASVLGPILILGGTGYALDRFLGTRFIVFAGVGIAFIVSNLLIYKKTKKLSESITEIDKENKKSQNK